ncbi:hypothetical protein SLS59_001856 [Nothophoma quercina]|uniref:Uncharacterized protein n=1 Tax=Nothophoma quercina TaxID=749835 RepID=A0ABR3RW56_9PLEO
MATLAPPVHRDKFFYSSVLYADAGNDNHHPRAGVAELTALLRPEAPKAKKSKTPEITEPAKDPPWHFWTAQLIHYGLTSTKDKNAAKIRLLSALNGNRLEVPGWIQKLESEVKKEWEAENKRLKKASREVATPKTPKSKEPTATDRASKPSTKQATVAKKGTGAKTPTKGIPVPPSNSAISSAVPITQQSTTAKRKRDEAQQHVPPSSNKKAKSKSTAEKVIAPPARTSTATQSPASQRLALAEEESWPAPQRDIIPHDAWRFFDHDHLAHTRPPNAPHPCPYRISCPDAEAEWDQSSIKEFYLPFSATEEEWWSRFEWGAFKGILILQRQPKRANKAVGVPFKWRAHDSYSNEDGDGEGKIFFETAWTLRGEFYNFFRERPTHFRGKAIQYAQKSIHGRDTELYRPPPGTPVLDQIRAEWSQMPTAMQDAPAKRPRAKKEKSATVTSTQEENTAPASQEQHDIHLSGIYKITSNSIEETFYIRPDNSRFRLILFTDEASGIWWASFQWAMFDGIIKMDPGPTYDSVTKGHACCLGWRINYADTGALKFGRGCTGEIVFDGRKRTLRGTLYNVPGVGEVHFEGQRMPGPRRVGSLERDWDGFIQEAYGRS